MGMVEVKLSTMKTKINPAFVIDKIFSWDKNINILVEPPVCNVKYEYELVKT